MASLNKVGQMMGERYFVYIYIYTYTHTHVSFVDHMQRQKYIFYKVRPYVRLYVMSVPTSRKYIFFLRA